MRLGTPGGAWGCPCTSSSPATSSLPHRALGCPSSALQPPQVWWREAGEAGSGKAGAASGMAWAKKETPARDPSTLAAWQPRAQGPDPRRVSTQLIQPLWASAYHRFVQGEPKDWTQMKKNGKASLQADYIRFSTHPLAVDVSTRERHITFFSIFLTVPSFPQQIKAFSWRVRNLSFVYYFKLAARALKQREECLTV